jgi:DNA-binding FadR family transcriptional regulator
VALSRVDQIVAEVAHRIGDGRLAVGQRLPAERALCATFGVGRTTLREALRLLLAQGYVVRDRRGLAVAGLPAVAARASIRDLYDVRKLIEVRIARWAALRATEDDVAELRDLVASSGPFHDALARATHNPVLLKVYEPSRPLFFHLPFYWPLLPEAEVETARARRHAMARDWHAALLEAIQQHDPDEAEGAMFQHLDSMEKHLFLSLRHGAGS